jgi:hypothetical protein
MDYFILFFSKGTSIEIYQVVSGGIVPFLEVPIMGRISVMKSFRPTVSALSCVIHFFILNISLLNKTF